jgi:IclR family acetate operon transcriptional repressor
LPPDRNPDSDDARGDGSFTEDRDYSLRAVDRVCAILDLLQQSVDGISLNTVVEATGMPKSSAYRYLWTLEAHRYVERDEETGLCRLGLGFLGMQSRHLELLRESARPWLERLRDDFGETSNLGVLDSDRIIYVDIIESRRGVRLAASRGDRDPLHSTALGKAIAAHLAEDRVRDVLARSGMPRRCANTITSIDDYLAELDNVRSIGYAVDNLENEADGRCVAVPLLGTSIPAAISLSAPAARFPTKDVGKAAKALLDVATRILMRPRPHAENGDNDAA